MDKSSRLWITAFVSIAAITVLSVTWMEGSVAQWDHDRVALASAEAKASVASANAKSAREAAHWKAKYTVLSHEADFLTVLSAEQKFQQQARAGQ